MPSPPTLRRTIRSRLLRRTESPEPPAPTDALESAAAEPRSAQIRHMPQPPIQGGYDGLAGSRPHDCLREPPFTPVAKNDGHSEVFSQTLVKIAPSQALRHSVTRILSFAIEAWLSLQHTWPGPQSLGFVQ